MNLITLAELEDTISNLPGFSSETARVLLVEDDVAAAHRLRRQLAESPRSRDFQLEHVDKLAYALQRLATASYDAVLLDLDLPDSFGLATFQRLYDQTRVPVVILSELDDEGVAVHAVREGAQDYLVKDRLSGELLARSLLYAIERHQTQERLRHLSLEDDLTGLYNRRGFITLAEQQRKLAVRKKHNLLVMFADLDGYRQIQEALGPQAGQQAVIETAGALRDTFRESDVVARASDDDFLVLLVETDSKSLQGLKSRLHSRLRELNARPHPHYELSISLGVAQFDPESEMTLDQLVDLAEMDMYAAKHGKGN